MFVANDSFVNFLLDGTNENREGFSKVGILFISSFYF